MLVGYSHIGKALRSARRRKGYSQVELARRLGVTQGTISRAEGGRDLRLGTLMEIARALDLEALLVPRRLVPAISALVGDGEVARRSAIYSGEEDEPYNEGDGETNPLSSNSASKRGGERGRDNGRERDLREGDR